MPVFNKVAREHFIDNLRSRADGKTMVDMMKEFGNVTLQMISMVLIFFYAINNMYDYTFIQAAFGTDFSKDPYVRSLAGGMELTYLLSHSFEGAMKGFMNPIVKVHSMFGIKVIYYCF